MTIQRNRSRNRDLNKVVNFLIGPDVTKEAPKDIYKFEVHVYFGDADMYQTLNLFIKDQNKAIEFADFLKNQLAVAYPNGRGGGEEYDYKNSPDIQDWNIWFGDGSEYDEETDDWIESDIQPEFPEEWPSNWEMGGEASYDYTNITYFDENGREFQVEIVLD